MDDSPHGGGSPSIAPILVAVAVLMVAVVMIAAGGGLQRPLTAPQSAVAMAPSHPRQG